METYKRADIQVVYFTADDILTTSSYLYNEWDGVGLNTEMDKIS